MLPLLFAVLKYKELIYMYQISNYSGKIKNTITNEVFDQDDRLQQYRQYLSDIATGVQLESIDFLDFEYNLMSFEKKSEKLQAALSDLRIRAKGLAIGKTGSNAYILTQVDLYQRKYENAVSTNPIPEIDADLEAEGLRDFNMNLADFKALIISMYTQGKERENLLMCFIEQGRSAILTLMTANEWVKVEAAFSLIENLKGITTIEEARIIKNQILAL